MTRAAQRLGHTQPSVSRSLATLRAAFGDELLVRAGRGMALTPLARALRTPVERTLASIDRLRSVGAFEPASASRPPHRRDARPLGDRAPARRFRRCRCACRGTRCTTPTRATPGCGAWSRSVCGAVFG